MNKEKKLVIFCSASYDIDQVYNQAAREIVRAACLRGYTIVSGGAIWRKAYRGASSFYGRV